MTHEIRKKLRERLKKRLDWLTVRVAVREDGGAKANLDREEMAALRWALGETQLLPQERAAKAAKTSNEQEIESLRKRIPKQQKEIEEKCRERDALRRALIHNGFMTITEVNELCDKARKLE
jgi:hypothetical protein